MSASPAGPPSGPPSTTPNGSQPLPQRRKRTAATMFIAKKKPGQRPVGPTHPTNGTSRPKTSTTNTTQASAAAADPDDDPLTFSEYPLVATKKSILEGLRYHAMRLIAAGEINPYDPNQFTRPLRLHRRFPRDKLNEPLPADVAAEESKEREKEEVRKAERQAQKEANQAQIAPTDKTTAKKKGQQFKKKVEDVYYPQDTPEAQKRSKLRYEEGRPWHLEDFDNKNTWIGSYEEPLSETHAMLVLDGRGHFRMVPLEKWYRFMPTGRYKTMDLDEAEKHMSKKIKEGRWFLEGQGGTDTKRRMETERQRRLEQGRVGMRGERRVKDEDEADGDRQDFANDVDEIDFEAEDEFQDDDEGKLFGEDEDAKEAEGKIRQEQLGANFFTGTGVKEEKDWDAEEQAEKKKAAEERKRQKKLRKTLVKQERKYEYESESDHPYSEDSDSEDSETERLAEEERKKKEEEEKLKVNGDKVPSGASTVGSNTPSGRTEKHNDPSRSNLSVGASLKRPGSPNLSEASGSESSRKRIKKEQGRPISRPMSPSVPDGARSMSPGARKGAGSGSDTEASGTERVGKPRIRIAGSKPGSPPASAPASRPSSPPPAGNAGVARGMPTAAEVRAAIPADGITIPELIKHFRAQIPKGLEGNTAFISLVKQVGRTDPQSKGLIVPK